MKKEKRKLQLFGVPSSDIDLYWVHAEPLLAKTLEYCDGRYETIDIYKFLKDRDMQLWVSYNDDKKMAVACVTEIIQYPRKKVMNIVFLAGIESETWLHCCENLKAFALSHGCQSVYGYGRKGWEKVSKPLGFKPIHTIYKFDFTH